MMRLSDLRLQVSSWGTYSVCWKRSLSQYWVREGSAGLLARCSMIWSQVIQFSSEIWLLIQIQLYLFLQSMQEEYPQIEQQNLLTSLRFVEEICSMLRLSRPCTKTSMDYFNLLNSSDTHEYQMEIMIAASIFLASKVFESQRKIRDILNMIFADTALHRIIRNQEEVCEQEGKQFSIKKVMANQTLSQALQPSYSINNYNDFKAKILEAEQHLLRVLGFDFSQSQKNLTEAKSILVLIHQLRLPPITGQTIINTYNDLPFTGAQKWIAGVVYFGYLVGNAASKNGKPVMIANEEWQTLFCTKIEKLRNYASKIATHYQNKHRAKKQKMQRFASNNRMQDAGEQGDKQKNEGEQFRG